MRFAVTYRIRADNADDARARAEGIALEQTVEIPRAVVPDGYIADEILGRVEEIRRHEVLVARFPAGQHGRHREGHLNRR